MTRLYRGVPASGGVAAGSVRVLRPSIPAANGSGRNGGPIMSPEEALDEVSRELTAAAARLRGAGHSDEAEIVAIGALIAEDPFLRSEIAGDVARGLDPPTALHAAIERQAAAMDALTDPVLRERAADIRQVGRRASAILDGGSDEPAQGDGPIVLLAEELGPADVIGLEAGEVAAGAAVRGGPNSHAAIVARTLGLPLVLGVDRSILEVVDGTAVVVDGDKGTVGVEPAESDVVRARTAMESAIRRREALARERGLASETVDGRPVHLLCNVATVAETKAGLEAGSEGVGLLRTELTFLEADAWPDEEAHRQVLGPILELLRGRRAIVRVLDFGGDKVPSFLAADLPSALGPHLRGLPALLDAREPFLAQLRAAVDLGRDCRLGILIPMVTSIRETRLAMELVEEAAREVGADVPELGVMVEVPSAALLADRLAQEVGFLSIGTNDLTEHVLGVNRRDPAARPALAAHPSVLTLINRVARAGRDQGSTVRVCGEAAADPLVVPLLVGLGIESLSVSPAKIDEVRSRVRRLSFDICASVARRAMAADSVEDVWELVRAACWPELP